MSGDRGWGCFNDARDRVNPLKAKTWLEVGYGETHMVVGSWKLETVLGRHMVYGHGFHDHDSTYSPRGASVDSQFISYIFQCFHSKAASSLESRLRQLSLKGGPILNV